MSGDVSIVASGATTITNVSGTAGTTLDIGSAITTGTLNVGTLGTGPVNVGNGTGALALTGATVGVIGATTVTGTLQTTGAVTLGSTLSAGATTLASAVVTGATTLSTVNISGAVTLSGGASTTTLKQRVKSHTIAGYSIKTLTIGSTATLVNVAVPMSSRYNTGKCDGHRCNNTETFSVSGAATLSSGASTTTLTATGEVLTPLLDTAISRNINHWFDSNIG